MAIPSGTKSLIQGLNFLEALHNQLLNVSKPESQKIEQYGVMCPRWAASAELSEAEAKTLFVDVVRRRAIQSVPILYAVKVLRELIKEQELSTSIPASEIVAEADAKCFLCRDRIEHRVADHRAAIKDAESGGQNG